MGSFDVLLDDERTQLDAFVEDHRRALEATLDGLTEERARRRLVPSATTLLGLVKHVTWMDGAGKRLEVVEPIRSTELSEVLLGAVLGYPDQLVEAQAIAVR